MTQSSQGNIAALIAQAPTLAAEVERLRGAAQVAEGALILAAHAARQNDHFESAQQYSDAAEKLRAALARQEATNG